MLPKLDCEHEHCCDQHSDYLSDSRTRAIAEARAAGRREGLEEAAKLTLDVDPTNGALRVIAGRIRALIAQSAPKPAECDDNGCAFCDVHPVSCPVHAKPATMPVPLPDCATHAESAQAVSSVKDRPR